MGESMDSLYRRGQISGKQMGRMGKPAILNKTKPQASKMAPFDDKAGRNDQGAGRERAEVPVNEINHPTNQGGKTGVSKGGSVGKSGQPSANAINEDQGPEFPRGGTVKGANGKRQVGVKGPPGKSGGPEYGGPSSRRDG